jgi:hypothetical protein
MNKKPYEAPAVKKVNLVIKNSILANCHASPSQLQREPSGCLVNPVQCYAR